MSGYKDYILDLPRRSIEILNIFEPKAKQQQLDVTLLLMVATTVFVMPKERLDAKHPSADFAKPENVELAKRLSSLQSNRFRGSILCPNDGENWCFGKFSTYQDVQDKYMEAKPLGAQPVSQITTLIRNALSHGNVLTDGNPIRKLVLISEKRKKEKKENIQNFSVFDGYQFLVLPIFCFREFLILWLKFLDENKADCSDILALLEAA